MINDIRNSVLVCVLIGLVLPGAEYDAIAATSDPAPAPLVLTGPVLWQGCFQGIDYAEMTVTQPRTMKGHMVRIDLTEPTLAFVVTPDNGPLPGETSTLVMTRPDGSVAVLNRPIHRGVPGLSL